MKFYRKWKLNREIERRWQITVAGLVGVKNVAKYASCYSQQFDNVSFAFAYDSCIQTSYLTRQKFRDFLDEQDEDLLNHALVSAYMDELGKLVREIEEVLQIENLWQ